MITVSGELSPMIEVVQGNILEVGCLIWPINTRYSYNVNGACRSDACTPHQASPGSKYGLRCMRG